MNFCEFSWRKYSSPWCVLEKFIRFSSFSSSFGLQKHQNNVHIYSSQVYLNHVFYVCALHKKMASTFVSRMFVDSFGLVRLNVCSVVCRKKKSHINRWLDLVRHAKALTHCKRCTPNDPRLMAQTNKIDSSRKTTTIHDGAIIGFRSNLNICI